MCNTEGEQRVSPVPSSRGDLNEATWRPLVAVSGVMCVKGWPHPSQLGNGGGGGFQ